MILNIDEFITGLDAVFDKGASREEVEPYFEKWKKQAEEEGDKAASVTILNEMMGYFRETSQYEKSIGCGEEALALMKEMNLENTLPYATTLLNTANALRAAGKLEESADRYGRVFALFEQLVSSEDFAYAELYNNVALLYQELGRFPQAVQCLRNALSICLSTEGKEFQTAVTYTNLGTSELHAGDIAGAVRDLQEAERRFAAMAVKDSHHAAAIASMAEAKYLMGNYQGAAADYETALAMIEDYIGRNEGWNRVYEKYQAAKQAAEHPASGMELAKDFYDNYGAAMLHEKFPDYEAKIAVGKAGAGSECFGYDDGLSRDHDFGPGFCMWLTDEDFDAIGERLNQEYQALYQEYITEGYRKHYPYLPNVASIVQAKGAENRTGARKIHDFYEEHTGFPEGPETESEWLMAEEAGLAASVNGEVFRDDAGIFTGIRNRLKKYYPERVRLLKIAQNTTMLGQAAQYNLSRCLERGDMVSAALERDQAVRCALHLVYLLNGTFAPHDKWMRTGIKNLPILSAVGEQLEEIVRLPISEKQKLTEKLEVICLAVLEEIKEQGIVTGQSAFLPDYATAFSYRAGLYSQSKDELAESISKMEFEAFDKVQNEGGRADCQDDWETFHIMRKSQYLSWPKELLVQYIMDFQAALSDGRNMITEKYARMMESTVPWEYEALKEKLPYIPDGKKAIVNEIVKIQVEWMENFAKEYPGLARNARRIHTSEDVPWDTSYETYLRGELLTYSDTLLMMYGRFIVSLAQAGNNLAYIIMEHTVHMYGYETLSEAERKENGSTK